MPHELVQGSAAGLNYRLYAPAARSAPLVVMLHGCTQDAASFAAATRMPEHARQAALVYPEQPPSANPQRCWNWFDPAHQARGGGEPAAIAALAQELVQEHGFDAERVYLVGISAGALMASITAAAYPEQFAAVGLHSGSAYPTVTAVADAIRVMQQGTDAEASAAAAAAQMARAAQMGVAPRGIPTVVVHGAGDAVVRPVNGDAAARAAWLQYTRAAGSQAEPKISTDTGATDGRPWTVTRYADAGGRTVVEYWLVDDLGHAWSGGVAGGSYADPAGPDAAELMIRFLMQHRLP